MTEHDVKLLEWNGGLHTRWHGAQDSWRHKHKDGTTWEWINPTTERFIPTRKRPLYKSESQP